MFWSEQDPALAARLRSGGGWGRTFTRVGLATGGYYCAMMLSVVLAVGLLALGLPAQALTMVAFAALGFLHRRHRRPAGHWAGRRGFGDDSPPGIA